MQKNGYGEMIIARSEITEQVEGWKNESSINYVDECISIWRWKGGGGALSMSAMAHGGPSGLATHQAHSIMNKDKQDKRIVPA